MSAIAGIIQFDGRPLDIQIVEKMTTAMARRGPDGVSHWLKGSAALGQCMLRTTPESCQEAQPHRAEDENLVLVMDGRVDNYEELRRELLGCGVRLRNGSDAELVLKAYEIWDELCLDHTIGEFVFFIWDARRRQLFGARDPAGTRHFYFHAGDGWFAFASEIKGLLALGRIVPRLNESRLLDYLAPQFDRDDEIGTFYRDIDRLPAGHAMRASAQGVQTWRYWRPETLTAARFASLEECSEAFLAELRIAVKCRLRSIGPVGAMLSGGMDSSSIVGVISKDLREELNEPLRTISLVRQDRENCPEWRSIRPMLEEGWIEPTVVSADLPSDFYRGYLDLIHVADEPFTLTHGLSGFVAYKIMQENGCRAVFEGMAGDLLFYFSDVSLGAVLRERAYGEIPAVLAAERRHGGHALRLLARKCVSSAAPDWLRNRYRTLRDKWLAPRGSLRLFRPEVRELILRTKYQKNYSSRNFGRGEDQMFHSRYFTTGLLSFAHEVYGQIALNAGVEPRSPFSDRRMIEFAIRMPLEAKLSSHWYKRTLRECMRGILPEEVRLRRAIGGHPGWTFYRSLFKERGESFINSKDIPNKLEKWIEPTSVEMMAKSDSYFDQFALFRLRILSYWFELGSRRWN